MRQCLVQGDNLLCLDPHSMQQTDATPDMLESHVAPDVLTVPFAAIDSTMALGFFCSSAADLRDLGDRMQAMSADYRSVSLLSVGAMPLPPAEFADDEHAWDNDSDEASGASSHAQTASPPDSVAAPAQPAVTAQQVQQPQQGQVAAAALSDAQRCAEAISNMPDAEDVNMHVPSDCEPGSSAMACSTAAAVAAPAEESMQAESRPGTHHEAASSDRPGSCQRDKKRAASSMGGDDAVEAASALRSSVHIAEVAQQTQTGSVENVCLANAAEAAGAHAGTDAQPRRSAEDDAASVPGHDACQRACFQDVSQQHDAHAVHANQGRVDVRRAEAAGTLQPSHQAQAPTCSMADAQPGVLRHEHSSMHVNATGYVSRLDASGAGHVHGDEVAHARLCSPSASGSMQQPVSCGVSDLAMSDVGESPVAVEHSAAESPRSRCRSPLGVAPQQLLDGAEHGAEAPTTAGALPVPIETRQLSGVVLTPADFAQSRSLNREWWLLDGVGDSAMPAANNGAPS